LDNGEEENEVSESLDSVEGVLATEIAPASRPRDSQGQFIRETRAPEHILQERQVEGDPLTGDTSDGGDDPAYRNFERSEADGHEAGRSSSQEERQDRERRGRNRAPQPSDADADDGYDLSDSEPENISAESESDSPEGEDSREADGSSRYEVTVDGQKYEVSLNEALNGYIRQATFHQRMAQVNQANRELEGERVQLQQGWAWWSKARQDYEEDLGALIPVEPNWDQLFAENPQHAHGLQKIYQNLYAKLNNSRALRAQREQQAAEEQDRRTQKYAVEGFTKFVMDHIKVMPDEPTLKKNINSMRRTASSAGFSDYEVATVYDPRMLDILWKASKYDRMTAAAPRAVVAGKGRTLAPGAATPFNGNARRSGFDDAQRRLAKSGKVSDAAEVFRFIT
jgi:hypothetical protein